MFPFIDHVDHPSMAPSRFCRGKRKRPSAGRRPERLRLSLPAPGAPLVSAVLRPPPEPIRRAGGSAGWLARLFGRPILSRAAV